MLSGTEGRDGVRIIGRIDRSIYRVVTPDITTDEVVITETQIAHIMAEHPHDYETYQNYLLEIVQEPDYILEDKPNTALVLKIIQTNGERFRLVLRLKTSMDPEGYKNSIITFMKTNESKWNQNLRNKKILYMRE